MCILKDQIRFIMNQIEIKNCVAFIIYDKCYEKLT